jgi:hypothetical protein
MTTMTTDRESDVPTEVSEAPDRPPPWCAAEGCRRPVDGHAGPPWCQAHRRGLRLSTAVSDATLEFLNPRNEKMYGNTEVIEAGEHLSIALELLLSSVFGSEVIVDERPIAFGTGDSKYDSIARWRVSFAWELKEQDNDI